MRSAGLTKARQNFSAILKQVRKGREVIITDRGRPVARIVPIVRQSARPFSSHRWVREKVRVKGRPLSEDLAVEREDRV